MCEITAPMLYWEASVSSFAYRIVTDECLGMPMGAGTFLDHMYSLCIYSIT